MDEVGICPENPNISQLQCFLAVGQNSLFSVGCAQSEFDHISVSMLIALPVWATWESRLAKRQRLCPMDVSADGPEVALILDQFALEPALKRVPRTPTPMPPAAPVGVFRCEIDDVELKL